jgi:NAD(P)-dependent dehydrogenase (short-subunit alcohol dehydrogenase family)
MKAQRFGRIIKHWVVERGQCAYITAAYNANKEAVRALSRTDAVEWGQHGITVNVICPAPSSPPAQEYFAANPDVAG